MCMCVHACLHVCVHVCEPPSVYVRACMLTCVCVCVCEHYDLSLDLPNLLTTEIKLGLKIFWYMRVELGKAMGNTSFTRLIHTIVV